METQIKPKDCSINQQKERFAVKSSVKGKLNGFWIKTRSAFAGHVVIENASHDHECLSIGD